MSDPLCAACRPDRVRLRSHYRDADDERVCAVIACVRKQPDAVVIAILYSVPILGHLARVENVLGSRVTRVESKYVWKLSSILPFNVSIYAL
jgi:hypothetical protein